MSKAYFLAGTTLTISLVSGSYIAAFLVVGLTKALYNHRTI